MHFPAKTSGVIAPGSRARARRRPVIGLALIALGVVAPRPAQALDEYLRAESLKPTKLSLCSEKSELAKRDECRSGEFDRLSASAGKLLSDALAKAAPHTRPLLKRDQVWFGDTLQSYSENDWNTPEPGEPSAYVSALQSRITQLEGIVRGSGRRGVEGRWTNAFGTVEATRGAGASIRVRIATETVYGQGEEKRLRCGVLLDARPHPDGWLAGIAGRAEVEVGKDQGEQKPRATFRQPMTVKLRLQGETLRVAAVIEKLDQENDDDNLPCPGINQLTGTYFAAGGGTAARSGQPAAVAAPSFDCVTPASATEEEICADPDLAANDVRLNRAWMHLVARLDPNTRKQLTEDQRGYVKSQTLQFPEFLHPAWEKQTSYMHRTTYGREKLRRLQLERIALLEGFEDARAGLEGQWISHTALLKIERDKSGALMARGWKWDQGDWKARCEYQMSGKLVNGRFVTDKPGVNPDTLERDGASLIVNGKDVEFIKKRPALLEAGKLAGADDDQIYKCRRNVEQGSTARLFPVRPSPDIDNTGGSIR